MFVVLRASRICSVYKNRRLFQFCLVAISFDGFFSLKFFIFLYLSDCEILFYGILWYCLDY